MGAQVRVRKCLKGYAGITGEVKATGLGDEFDGITPRTMFETASGRLIEVADRYLVIVGSPHHPTEPGKR
jgi:hypothetical protein